MDEENKALQEEEVVQDENLDEGTQDEAEQEPDAECPDVSADDATCDNGDIPAGEDIPQEPEATYPPVEPQPDRTEEPGGMPAPPDLSKYDLTLDGIVFNAMKTDFDNMLNTLLNTMTTKESESAEINIKIKVTLEEGTAPDLRISAYHADREIYNPKFEHTISSTIQIKNKKDGFVGGSKYELFFNRETRKWAMRPIEEAQLSMFNTDHHHNQDPPSPQDDAPECPENEQMEIADSVEADACPDRDACETIDRCGQCCINCPEPCSEICPVAAGPQSIISEDPDDDDPECLDNEDQEYEYEDRGFPPYEEGIDDRPEPGEQEESAG
jgi:hypothetical protein